MAETFDTTPGELFSRTPFTIHQFQLPAARHFPLPLTPKSYPLANLAPLHPSLVTIHSSLTGTHKLKSLPAFFLAASINITDPKRAPVVFKIRSKASELLDGSQA